MSGVLKEYSFFFDIVNYMFFRKLLLIVRLWSERALTVLVSRIRKSKNRFYNVNTIQWNNRQICWSR